MKKNKYAASLDTISRPQNMASNKNDIEAIAKAIEEGERRNYERLVVAVSNLFGYHGPLYAGNVAASLIKIFNLQKKENFNRFKKNIDDGYTAWFIYRFYYRQRCIESTIYPFEYSIYERDQTYGIQDFKKRFKPSAWKALVKIPAYRQFSLSRWYQSDRALEILAKCLHVGTDTHALEWLDGFISKPVSMDLIEEILLFLKKCDKDANTFSTAAKDIIDHIEMWDSLQKLKIKYPEIVKNLGVPLSGKWSLRRFADEHSRLSQMKRDCDREQILEKERREKWKKKNFFNIHKFPQLKGTTIDVEGNKLHIKLINTSLDLYNEGSEMHHCIFNHLPYMKASKYFAFKVTDELNKRNCCTIAFNVRELNARDSVFGTSVMSGFDNSEKEKFEVLFDQVRGLRNQTNFTFRQSSFVEEIVKLIKDNGFYDYVTNLPKRPFMSLKYQEARFRLVKNMMGSNGLSWSEIYSTPTRFIPRMVGDFDGDVIGMYPRMEGIHDRAYNNNWGGMLANANNQPFHVNLESPIQGLQRFRETLVDGFRASTGALNSQIELINRLDQGSGLYVGAVKGSIQSTISASFPRPEEKEKPFLNSDFLKMVSNG